VHGIHRPSVDDLDAVSGERQRERIDPRQGEPADKAP
jgi:hypothetical protein